VCVFVSYRFICVTDLFQTKLPNDTYQQHSIEQEESIAVFTSYNGVFGIEVPLDNLIRTDCSSVSYELLSESNSCIGKFMLLNMSRRLYILLLSFFVIIIIIIIITTTTTLFVY